MLSLYYDTSREGKKCNKNSSTVVSQVNDKMECELFHSDQAGAVSPKKLSFAVRPVLFIEQF